MDKEILEKILQLTIENKTELVHKDHRGKIWRLEIDGKEYIIMETARGELRGGDYHQTAQHDLVLKGKILWIEKTCLSCEEGKGEDTRVVKEGEEITSKPNVPHMMVSFGGPSLVLEWLEGSFEKQYYKPFRDKIEAGVKA